MGQVGADFVYIWILWDFIGFCETPDSLADSFNFAEVAINFVLTDLCEDTLLFLARFWPWIFIKEITF